MAVKEIKGRLDMSLGHEDQKLFLVKMGDFKRALFKIFKMTGMEAEPFNPWYRLEQAEEQVVYLYRIKLGHGSPQMCRHPVPNNVVLNASLWPECIEKMIQSDVKEIISKAVGDASKPIPPVRII